MAINFTDFSKIPTQKPAVENLLGDFFKGYEMGGLPAKLKEEANQRKLSTKEKELSTALKSKALEHYEEKFNLERDVKKSQIEKNLQKNLGGNPKANGEFANYLVAHPDATPEEKLKAYDEIHNRKAEHENTIINRGKDVVSGTSYDKLPTNDKKQVLALMKGMGVDPILATSLLRKGVTPTQYAKDNGIDITKVNPVYAPGEQNVKDSQRAAAYMDEIDVLDNHIQEGLGPYQNKIMEYSLKQIAEAAEGKNPEEQGKFLAARALVPELNALRLKIAGGNIGIEALNELKEQSLASSKIVESLVDSKTYNAMQKYMKDWIKEAGQVRINTLNSFGKLKGENSNDRDKALSSALNKKSNPELISTQNGISTVKYGGKTLKIPENLLDKFMMEHSKPEFGGQYE